MDSLIGKQLKTHEMTVLGEHDVPIPNPGAGGPALAEQQETGRKPVTCHLIFRYDRQISKLKAEIVNLRHEGADIQAEIESMTCQTPAEGTEDFKAPHNEMLAEIQLTREKLDTCLNKNKALERLHAELVKANEELINALELSEKAWWRNWV